MRTWTRTEAADRSLTWRSDDHGGALVTVRRDGAGWRVEFWERGQWIGSEPRCLYRSTAAGVARKWVRALSRPVERA